MECCLIDRESHQLESVLNEIKFDSSIEHTDFKNKLTICLDELKLLHTEISAIQLLHDSDGCNYEGSLELLVMTLKAENKANSFIIMAQDFEISRYKVAHELSRVRAKFSHRVDQTQKAMIAYKSAKVENSRKCTKVLVSSTDEKWLPYREKYNELIADGIEQKVALNMIGNKIEAAIKANPAQTPFDKRPNRTTIYRQLVEKFK